MIGLLILVAIGRSFWKLAVQFDRNKWVWSVVSIVVLYGVGIVGSGLIYLIGELISSGSIERWNETFLGFMGMVFGGFVLWGLHVFLRKRWSRVPNVENTLDGDLD